MVSGQKSPELALGALDVVTREGGRDQSEQRTG
jgi:hypothetical protein